MKHFFCYGGADVLFCLYYIIITTFLQLFCAYEQAWKNPQQKKENVVGPNCGVSNNDDDDEGLHNDSD